MGLDYSVNSRPYCIPRQMLLYVSSRASALKGLSCITNVEIMFGTDVMDYACRSQEGKSHNVRGQFMCKVYENR